MKRLLTATLLGALIMAADATAQTAPPPVVTPIQAPPPPAAPPVITQRDGPYHVLLHAKVDARERRAHGLHAEVVGERGMWWVVYYP